MRMRRVAATVGMVAATGGGHLPQCRARAVKFCHFFHDPSTNGSLAARASDGIQPPNALDFTGVGCQLQPSVVKCMVSVKVANLGTDQGKKTETETRTLYLVARVGWPWNAMRAV